MSSEWKRPSFSRLVGSVESQDVDRDFSFIQSTGHLLSFCNLSTLHMRLGKHMYRRANNQTPTFREILRARCYEASPCGKNEWVGLFGHTGSRSPVSPQPTSDSGTWRALYDYILASCRPLITSSRILAGFSDE